MSEILISLIQPLIRMILVNSQEATLQLHASVCLRNFVKVAHTIIRQQYF